MRGVRSMRSTRINISFTPHTSHTPRRFKQRVSTLLLTLPHLIRILPLRSQTTEIILIGTRMTGDTAIDLYRTWQFNLGV